MAMLAASKPKRRLLNQPPSVIKRWSRLRNRRFALKVSRAYMRWLLPYRERKRLSETEATYETIRYYAIKNENGNFRGLSLLFNIGLYLLIADRDIQASKIDALTHPNEWKRKLSARIILLTIYEWDADKVTGRALRESLELMQIPDELRREATDALGTLRTIQKKASVQFKFIRNNAIAHRNPDALIQHRAIRDLDVNEVMKIAGEFYAAIGQFIGLLTKLMHAGNTLPSMLSQWSATRPSVSRQ